MHDLASIPIAIFATGGTIDKVYFDAKGGYVFNAGRVRKDSALNRFEDFALRTNHSSSI